MLNEQEIKSLLLKTAARDADAFAQLYALTAPIMLGIANRVLNRKELAEEVLQDVFVKIWRQATQFDPLSNQPIGWIATMTRNRALDIIGSADVSRVVSVDTSDQSVVALIDDAYGAHTSRSDPSDHHNTVYNNRIVKHCLENLPAIERQSIALAYYHGLSHQELAHHLQKPLGSVKTWVRRGMSNLKQCVEDCMKGSTP